MTARGSLRLMMEECSDPRFNLSIEEAVLNAVDKGLAPNTLRLWVNSPSVIIGSAQAVDSSVNLDFCVENEVDVVRRFTGGGAVYHDEGNLNWSFTVKRDEASPQGILKPYEIFGTTIADALGELGLQTAFARPNRIDLNGRKISGMAGYVKARALLVHGTLLVDTDLATLNSVCVAPKGAPPVTSLSDEAGGGIRIRDVKRAILDFLAEKAGVECRRGRLTREEERLAHTLHSGKYALLSWNLGF